MENIKQNITELIGATPMVELCCLKKELGLKGRLAVKLESYNPTGSAKDRVALNIIEEAEKSGELQKGGVIIEPTSGNTGIGLAAIATVKGYRCIIVLPDTMSIERQNLIRAYGAEVVLTEGNLGMKGAIDKAEELKREIKGSIIAGQFTNPANPAVHRLTTGPEIWRDCDGKVDVFVAGVGTGGTITGCGEYLKSQNPAIRVVAVEPESSPLLSKGVAGAHRIQGIGANFIPEILNTEIYDEIIAVDDEKCFEYGRLLALREGILTGISGGAALYAGIKIAKREESEGKLIVVLITDGADRYYSTELFNLSEKEKG